MSRFSRAAFARGEVIAAALAMVALVLLTGAPAPAETRGVATAGDLAVSLALTPNTPGSNAVTISAASSRRPAPEPIEAVGLLLGDTAVVALQPVEPGLYAGAVRIERAGRLAVAVVVRRGTARTTVPMDWTVGRRVPVVEPRYAAVLLLVIVSGLFAASPFWRSS